MNISDDPVALVIVIGAGGIVLLLLAVACLKRPWWATVAAIASLPLIPFWSGFGLGGYFISFHMTALALAIVAIIGERRAAPPLLWADVVLVLVFLVLLFGLAFRLISITQPYTMLQWLLAYAFARTAAWAYGVRRVATAAAFAYAAAAAAILVEFLTGFNPWTQFVVFDNTLYARWGGLQSRGGVPRAEGAFGHSIAAGCSLAVAAVLTLDAKLRSFHRIVLVALLCAAILTTISRIGIITAALGIGLAVVFARSTLTIRAKVGTVLVGMVGSGVYAAILSGVFVDAGDEASNSASYRTWLLDLLPTLRPFGIAAGAVRSTNGDLSFGGYLSVDNAVLHFALLNGWVPSLILLSLMAAAVWQTLRLRAGIATVALVAAIPSLFTVALITQWALVFWLAAGLAVGEHQASRPSEKLPETDSTSLPPPSSALLATHQVEGV